MLIGISGKKRSGKDTFYEILKETVPEKYIVKRYSFADGVRGYAETYFKIPVQYWKDDSFKEENRYILQGIGQMIRSECDEDFWVKQVLDKYNKDRRALSYGEVPKTNKFIGVITDVRYPNEARLIRDSGILLRINRPYFDKNDYHPSEVSLDEYNFNHIINNDEGIDTYVERVREWIQKELL